MKRKPTKILTFCMICFILLAPLGIVAEYSARENGDVMAGTPESNRIYTIGTQNVNNRVFDVQNAQTADNSVVWTYPYNGDECQEWRFIKQGSDYAIQDTHSGKYLTVKNNSSSTDAEVVISSRPSSGYSTGQLFRVEQIGTSMRYRLLTKCSNYTLAIGFNSSYYLRQLAMTNATAKIYLTESAPYHGLQEGYVHIQQYNTSYSIYDKMLGVHSASSGLTYSQYSNSATFEWRVRYEGNSCFTISCDGYYLRYAGTSPGATVSVSGTYSATYCLWKITKTGNYYQFTPKNAVSSIALGVSSTTPQLVYTSTDTSKWRVIRSHDYSDYNMTIYAAEDRSHSNNYQSHSDIFHYACSALYLRGKDNQNLIFTNNASPDYTQTDITYFMKNSSIFVLRAHGSSTSFLLNARDGNGNNIGTAVTYNLSLINNLGSSELNSLKCALFISCHSAEGAYTSSSSSNFVKAVVNRGARSAIGFDGLVDCRKASNFANLFFKYYARARNIDQVVAREAFESALELTESDYAEGSYMPYFYNGMTTIKFPIN